MVFIISIITIAVISFLWALWSLHHELTKPKALKTIQNELAREKILFKKS